MCKETIRSLFLRRGRFVLETGRDHRLKEWHHGTQFRAELLDGVLLLALTRGEEVGAALFIFFDPGFRKAAVADLRKDLAHFFSRLLGDDARSSGIITLFGSITDGVAHVAEATTVNQVDDQLELMEAFEVGNLGLIACFRERLEARLDQFTHAAAKYGLLAKEVRFGFFGESGFQNAGTRAAESFGVSESKRY